MNEIIADSDIPVMIFLLCIIIVFGALVEWYDHKKIQLSEKREQEKKSLLKEIYDIWDENSYH